MIKETVFITILSMSFNPKKIVIKPGTTVVWENKDNRLHNVYPFCKKLMFKGDKCIKVFEEVGEFKYYCTPHRTMGMEGTINVEENETQVKETTSKTTGFSNKKASKSSKPKTQVKERL